MSSNTIERRPVGMSAWYAALAVRNVEQSAAYYLNRLGFYSWGYGFRGERRVQCTVFRDRAMIALAELKPGIAPRPLRGIVTPPDSGTGSGWEPDVEIQVVDLAGYFAEVSARGARVVKPLTDEEEPTFVVEDGNGYHVSFAQCEPRVTADGGRDET